MKKSTSFRVWQEGYLRNARIILQRTTARREKNMWSDGEFPTLSEYTFTFVNTQPYNNNDLKKKIEKVAQNFKFLVLVDSDYFHCIQNFLSIYECKKISK